MKTILTKFFVATAVLTAAAAIAQTHAAQVQKVTIHVDNGFNPASVTVRAGRPVELTFDTKRKGCAGTVFFKSLKIKTKLENGKKTVVKFTPKKTGKIDYACSMDMLKGTIVVK